MPLNIRPSFVKIWGALSALWIVCVAAIAATEELRSRQPVDRFAYSLQLDRLAPSGSAEVESFPEWFLTERDFPQDGITLALPVPPTKGLWKAREEVEAAKRGAAVEKDERRPGEAYATVVARSAMPDLIQRARHLQMQGRMHRFGAVLGTALLPPALLLLLGVLVGWATRMPVSARDRAR
jgi:hypothetical protein